MTAVIQEAPPVELTDVAKTYSNGTVAVGDFNLTVSRGEFVTIVGPSGCGKSTVLRMVAGLGKPTGGQVLVNGLDPVEARRQPKSLSYVFQDPTLMPWRRVLSNVMLPFEFTKTPKAEAEERARAALELVGLKGQERAFPRSLSGGMRMRVSIARALAPEPSLLLMDEPFGALDEITRQRLNTDLQKIYADADRNLTVCFVTHNLFEAVYLSTRVIVMGANPGRVIDVVDIDKSYPRTEEFRNSMEFVSLCDRIAKGIASDERR
jgi:ABC-type nitrate/sulfonate/bicarbonate transport system, ATPase component